MHNAELATPLRTHEGRGSDSSFTVVAIHHGYQAEMRVNQVFGWLHQSFRADLKIAFNSWHFAKLEAALDIRSMSIRISSAADMIIIATSDGEPIPEHIKRWLESIMQQKRDGRILIVALEDHTHSVASHYSTLCAYVQHEAARWHADFICCEDLQQQMSRQFVLRFINERFHESFFTEAETPHSGAEKTARLFPSTPQHMKEMQSSMTSSQIQEIRGLAYHLWLQADRPAGREIDFWLQAEQQIKRAAEEATFNTANAALAATKKPKTKANP